MKTGRAGRTPHPSPSSRFAHLRQSNRSAATLAASQARANGNARLTLTLGLRPRSADPAWAVLPPAHRVRLRMSVSRLETTKARTTDRAKRLSMKHSATRDLFAHWNDRRGVRALPERGDIEPAAIRASLGDTFILGAEPGEEPRFRLAGTRVCALFGRELKDDAFTAVWDLGYQAAVRRLLAIVGTDEIGVVAGARARTPEGFSCDLELLLLPLRHCGRSGRRMLGALAPLALPAWLRATRLDPLALGSLRYLAAELEPAPSRLAAALAHEQPRRGLVVYEGGRS